MSTTSTDVIASRIFIVRGRRVMLDSDLAELYGVETRRLNEQVRRNHHRFPSDFVFEPTNQELAHLKSHFATSSWGGRRKRLLAFTEHGAIQAATVLNTPRAVEVSVYVVRAFVQLRELLASSRELAKQFEALEAKLTERLDAHDEASAQILETIRELMSEPSPGRRPIGFTARIE